MIASNRVCYAGRLLSAVGVFVFGAHLAVAEERDGGGRLVTTPSPASVESPKPAVPDAATRAEILQSDVMLEPIIWWEKYYAATVQDDQEELEALKARIVGMSTVELREFLVKFRGERQLARHQQAARERVRQQLLACQQAYRRRQQAARQAALDRGYVGNRPYFGTTERHFSAGIASSASRQHRVVWPRPITSRSVATFAVHRSLYGRGW